MSLKIYRKNKETVWMTLGNKCVRCGCKHNLQLDHIDPQTKKFDVTPKLGSKLGPLWEEIHKCQLLCESCHREKNKEDQEVIQMKRKDFIHVDHRFDPILQENMCHITIDESKKDGRAYIKYVDYIAKKKGVDFWDVVTEHNNEYEAYSMFVMLKKWDTIDFSKYDIFDKDKSVEQIKKEKNDLKNYLEKYIVEIKQEDPDLYKGFEIMYLKDKNKINQSNGESFSKIGDRVVVEG